jgi:hypothetical protein
MNFAPSEVTLYFIHIADLSAPLSVLPPMPTLLCFSALSGSARSACAARLWVHSPELLLHRRTHQRYRCLLVSQTQRAQERRGAGDKAQGGRPAALSVPVRPSTGRSELAPEQQKNTGAEQA